MSIDESHGTLTIPVLREGGSFGVVSVLYLVSNEEAINGEDFEVTEVAVCYCVLCVLCIVCIIGSN